METYIPFTGFYNSNHDAMLDDALESVFQDNNGTPHTPEDFNDHIDWHKVREAYAKDYVKRFKDWLNGIDSRVKISLTFKSLYSPKEYNFEMDRILCDISIKNAQRLMDATNQGELAKVIKDRFTPCSGFIPFYSDDVLKWLEKPLKEWDCNELETLILAYIESMGELMDDYEIMEPSRCNNGVNESLEAGFNDKAWEIINAHDAKRRA